jgi:3-(3-hydroxy-phenyl)propionate hydroxylase
VAAGGDTSIGQDLDTPDVPVTVLTVRLHGAHTEPTLSDSEGLLAQRYDLKPGTVVLLRPDQHVCARWRHPTPAQIRAALRRAAALA